MRRHVALDEPRSLALVESGRAARRDARERAGKIGLHEPVAGRVRRAVLRELRQRRRVSLHRRQRARKRGGKRLADREPVAGQGDGRLHQPPPGELPLLLPRQVQACNRAGHAHREVAVVVLGRVVLPIGEEHRRRGGRRRHLAEVVGDRLARLGPVHDEAAPADVARRRVDDRKREGRRHGGVDRIAPGLQDRDADLRGDGILRHHHAVRRPKGLGRREDRHGSGHQQRDQHEPASHRGTFRQLPCAAGPRGSLRLAACVVARSGRGSARATTGYVPGR